MALNDYARTNDPFTQVGRQQVAVEVSSVIRASPDSFRVAWVERRYENGQLAETTRWTAILTIVVQTRATPNGSAPIPLGIYVNAINWSREMSPMKRGAPHQPGSPAFRKSALPMVLLSADDAGGMRDVQSRPKSAMTATCRPLPAARRRRSPTSRRGRCTRLPAGRRRMAEPPRATPTGSRRERQCRGPRRAAPRGLLQRDPGLPLERRRALSGLCRAGQITNIALEPGESLTGAGPIAAGDTARWIIGDTESGAARLAVSISS